MRLAIVRGRPGTSTSRRVSPAYLYFHEVLVIAESKRAFIELPRNSIIFNNKINAFCKDTVEHLR